eukprot:5378290-Amphidinium_carterae.1
MFLTVSHDHSHNFEQIFRGGLGACTVRNFSLPGGAMCIGVSTLNKEEQSVLQVVRLSSATYQKRTSH